MPAASAPSLPILPAHRDHVAAFLAFLAEHRLESGRDGSPHFSVGGSDPLSDEVRLKVLERWSRPLDEPLWGRAWLLWTGVPPAPGPAGFHQPTARVVGHVELQGGRVKAEMHRATLAIGMLRPHTGQGHGRRLMETAIAWARDDARLSYIDLGVFVGNERAKRLYERMGFVEQGLRRDAFRVGDTRIDDIQMTLAL